VKVICQILKALPSGRAFSIFTGVNPGVPDSLAVLAGWPLVISPFIVILALLFRQESVYSSGTTPR
jgi:hypothetical protein